tara:strand:- start:188 stop:817 length:630 start_codon:yes stop_codon:yes gene_type:complete
VNYLEECPFIKNMSTIRFKNVDDPRVKKIFLKVLSHYKPLQDKKIDLVQRRLKKTTMRAQPVLSTFLGGKHNRRYKIEMNNSVQLPNHIKLEELDDEVLYGWLAHEMGHLMDYLRHGFFGMLKYGLLYLASSNYRMGAERRADLFAIEYGMSDQILATKEYILEKSNLSDKYKARIRKYYMSADEVLMMVEGEEKEELRMDDVNIFDPR